jgi:hypothetical protein
MEPPMTRRIFAGTFKLGPLCQDGTSRKTGLWETSRHWRTSMVEVSEIGTSLPELAGNQAIHAETGIEQSCYSQRKTFAESAAQMTKTKTSPATSPRWANHGSPFQIPWSRRTA